MQIYFKRNQETQLDYKIGFKT